MLGDGFIPTYTISDKSAMLMTEIGIIIGSSSFKGCTVPPNIFLDSKIKSIHSSLAIENNSLSLDQVTDIVNGKKVYGPKKDVIEVKNAYEAYKGFDDVDPFNIDDLMKIHGIMMEGLIDHPGVIRTCNVGVFSGSDCIYLAPEPDEVSGLMKGLFKWLNEGDAHPLIKSCVFHYEFEYIHPFEDRNGRTGRYWQSLLLSQWEPIFSQLPIENLIFDKVMEYYAVINKCNSIKNCGLFIEYMLTVIRDSLLNYTDDQITDQVTDQEAKRIKMVVKCLQDEPQTVNQIMLAIGVKHKPNFRENYLLPALRRGFIEMTEPDNPHSKNQRYKLKK